MTSPPSPESITVTTRPEGKLTVECEVVFHVQSSSSGQESTPKSPFHQSRTRFHNPVSSFKRIGTGFSSKENKNVSSSDPISNEIENKLLSVVSQASSSASLMLAPAERPKSAQKLITGFRNPVDPDEAESRSKFEQLQHRARQLLQAGDDLNAERCLKEVLCLCPSHAETYFNLGTIEHFFRHDPEKATDLYKLALDLDENHIPSMLNLASVEIWQKNKRGCEKLLREVLYVDKQHCDAMCGLGILYLEDNAQAAETWFRKVLAKDPTHETTLYNFGLLLRSRGDAEGPRLLRRCVHGPLCCEAVITHSIAYPSCSAGSIQRTGSSNRSMSLTIPVHSSATLSPSRAGRGGLSRSFSDLIPGIKSNGAKH